jgi:hypothetical protein
MHDYCPALGNFAALSAEPMKLVLRYRTMFGSEEMLGLLVF